MTIHTSGSASPHPHARRPAPRQFCGGLRAEARGLRSFGWQAAARSVLASECSVAFSARRGRRGIVRSAPGRPWRPRRVVRQARLPHAGVFGHFGEVVQDPPLGGPPRTPPCLRTAVILAADAAVRTSRFSWGDRLRAVARRRGTAREISKPPSADRSPPRNCRSPLHSVAGAITTVSGSAIRARSSLGYVAAAAPRGPVYGRLSHCDLRFTRLYRGMAWRRRGTA